MTVDGLRSRVRLFALALTAAVVIAACSTSSSSAPASASPTGPQNLGTLNVGMGTAPPDLTAMFLYFGVDQGFYKKRGLDVQMKPFNGDTTALRALATGDVDVEWTGCAAAMQAIEVGAPLRIVSAFNPQVDYLFVAQTGINSPKDLVGKAVGVSQPGAVSWSVPKLMIQGDGGDFSKVNVVSIGGTSARLQALVAKKIDGAVLNNYAVLQTTKYDYLHVIADAVKALPNFLYACEVTTQKVLDTRKPALQAWVTGTMESVRWFYNNSDGAAAIVHKVLPDLDTTLVAASLKAFAAKQYWKPEGLMPQDAWTFTNKTMQDSGDLKGPLDYSKIVVTEFALNAQKEFPK